MVNQISHNPAYIPVGGEKACSLNESPSHHEKELKKVCSDFEAIFVAQLLKTMRSSVEKSGLFEESSSSEVYESMFDFEVSKSLAASGGIGLANILYQSLASQLRSQTGEDLTSDAVDGTYHPNLSGSTFENIKRFHNIIADAAQENDVPVNLVYAVIAQESAGQPLVVSKKGAKGLMQLMDITAEESGVLNPFDPRENINAGVLYLKKQLDRFAGNVEVALAAYNAGPANVEKYNGIPPFDETQNYVKKVMAYSEEYEALLQNKESEEI